MNSLMQIAFLISLSLALVVFWILPIFNLHIITNDNQILRQKAQKLIDENRQQQFVIKKKMEELDLAAVQIKKVEKIDFVDYEKYKIVFEYKNLFHNYFDSENDLKTISFLVDKN